MTRFEKHFGVVYCIIITRGTLRSRYSDEFGYAAFGSGRLFCNPFENPEVDMNNSEKTAEDRWSAVEAAIGREARVALEEHYALFDERFYLWLADLYDPQTGGFYCTNAARDTEGYLPDIQSTAQVLAFLDNSGMTREAGGWQYAIPVEIADKTVNFVKGLQSSEDGYVYHPQWEGMKYTESRLGRDVNWVSEILRPLYRRYEKEYRETGCSEDEAKELLKKYMPYWDTPAGQRGSLGKPSRTRTAVSDEAKGAPAAWTPQLRSLEAWRAYLYGGTVGEDVFSGLDLSGDSYTVGNKLAAQTTQIRQRDTEAAASGEPTGYAELTRRFLDEGIREESGLWEDEVKYNSVNGLMKICSVYNGMGWAFPCPDRAMRSAMTVATLDGPDCDGKWAVASVDIYNPWVAISGLFLNVENYGDPDKKDRFVSVWREELKSRAASMIRGTSAKIKRFAKDDGSYGYHWGAPSAHAQGMPITVPGVVCGDVDGGCIASTGTLGRICAALDIKEIVPPLFDSVDLERFTERLLSSERQYNEKKAN